ncbi:hypothetical protein SS50377_21047 [Spironucleus salmonicida]|uniref:THUMP domain-containing protein n=1 Tax=Spironucleus salmonicida TaxID=348837 RepID=V6LJ51_9EUKA|nr:hypothetical protein SS50377_21047 [Spironucleus salmonicida]|eukprot:EST43706.1 Hypothetical protein SS50377_16759 [Spironucleus salmonicida]
MPPQGRSKQFYCRQKALGIEKGDNFLSDLQGILVTSSINDNFKISREIYSLLKQFTEAIPNALEQTEHKFNKLLPGAKGLLFVYWPILDGQDSPRDVIMKLLKRKAEGTNLGCIAKIYPVSNTCKADLSVIKKVIDGLLVSDQEKKFSLEFKIRNNNGLTKDSLKSFILETYAQNYSEEEDKAISIQICQCNAMIGWCDKYID